jgi:asparagine synthase (glutamine-hydrolysing)
MSAILGMFHLDGGPADDEWLSSMWRSLSHRGLDGGSVWKNGSVGLGHQMVWTTPESLIERMPYCDEDAGLSIVADARIDNREELIEGLNLQDGSEAGKTDSRLILAAYEKWGEDCVDRLVGDFAFAIWNRRNQSLYCVRDHFGIRPFYYYYKKGEWFLFATEIRALLAVPVVPRILNETRVADYLESFVEDEEITFYQDIQRLPRSTALKVNHEGLKVRQYWALDPGREIRYGSNEAYAEAFREKFFQAVQCRLRSAYPIGASLSGGLDSSSVVQVSRMLLRENGNLPLHTFSAIFDEVPQSDERDFIHSIPRGDDLSQHFIHLDRFGALSDIDSTLWHAEQPLFIRNMFLWTAKYKIAKEIGVRVFLDGEDGDTVISHGDAYLKELALHGMWKEFHETAEMLFRHFVGYHASNQYWLRTFGYPCLEDMIRNGQLISFARAVSKLPRYFDVSRWHLIWNQGIRPTVPESWRRSWRRLQGKNENERTYKTLVNEDLAYKVKLKDRQRLFWSKIGNFSTLREAHCQALTSGIHSCINEESNKGAAAFNVECRHPFYDRRVVEFCLALPPEQKISKSWPRWILRNSMKKFLPEKICWRVGKSNLGYNFQRCLMVLEREKINNILIAESKMIEKFVNRVYFENAYQKEIANRVWPVVILAIWLRQTQPSETFLQKEVIMEGTI